jgi:hypothetical protein
MQVFTRADAVSWCDARGLRAPSGRTAVDLVYPGEDHHCLEIVISREALRAIALGYVLLMSLVRDDEEVNFGGGLLWLRDWNIWSETTERVGDYVVQGLRNGLGIRQPLEAAPAHLFTEKELTAAQAFLAQPMIYQWDAYLVPVSAEYFVFISHGGSCYIVAKTRGVFEQLLQRFQNGNWNPKESRLPYMSR